MKQRILYLDVIRVLACFMVICMHAPMEYNGEAPTPVRAFMVYSSYWTIPCVCLFFAVSGALLLQQNVEPTESGKWLKKRLNKVIAPTLIWTFFYIIVKYYTTGENFTDVLKQIISIPFSSQGHGVLWFMYTLVGLYLVTPIISPWIRNCGKNTIQLYLVFWIVTLCYPILTEFVEINETPYGILYYFSGFLGYYVLGYYLNTYGLKGSTWMWTILLICLMPLRILYKLYIDDRFDFGDEVLSYLGIVCMLMLLCWWKISTAVSSIIGKHSKVVYSITKVSNLSFGIYLMHIFVMRTCVERVTGMIPNYYLQTFATIIATLLVTIGISYAISLLPFGDYIIGYKEQKERL